MDTETSEDEISRVQERLENSDLDTLLFLVTEITDEEYSQDYGSLFHGFSVYDIVVFVLDSCLLFFTETTYIPLP